MQLTVVAYEDEDADLQLLSAWDATQVASDPELVTRQIAEAFTLLGAARAGSAVIDIDDDTIRSGLARSLPEVLKNVAPVVPGDIRE